MPKQRTCSKGAAEQRGRWAVPDTGFTAELFGVILIAGACRKVHCSGREEQGVSGSGSSPELSHGVRGWCHQHTKRKLLGLSFIPAW